MCTHACVILSRKSMRTGAQARHYTSLTSPARQYVNFSAGPGTALSAIVIIRGIWIRESIPSLRTRRNAYRNDCVSSRWIRRNAPIYRDSRISGQIPVTGYDECFTSESLSLFLLGTTPSISFCPNWRTEFLHVGAKNLRRSSFSRKKP